MSTFTAFGSRSDPPVFSSQHYDADVAMQGEVVNAAKTLAEAAHANHEGRLLQAGRDLKPPRQK